MEPEDQSRNARPKPDPVTIDLGAEEVKEMPAADSDATEENVTAEAAPEQPSSEQPAEATAAAESSARSYSGIPNSTTPPRATAPERPRGQSSLGLIAASLLGGVVALGGAAGLQYWGVLPSLGANEKTEASLNLMASDIMERPPRPVMDSPFCVVAANCAE